MKILKKGDITILWRRSREGGGTGGYGYFGSFEDLELAVEGREDKSGGAVVYLGAEVIREGEREFLRGELSGVYFIKILPDGSLDIRTPDSFDNE